MYDQITTAIEQGRNIFITGPAGTGKSYTLDLLKQDYDMIVTASTGAAAVNVGGTTIHSFAGIGLADKPVDEILERINPYVEKRIQRCGILAVDEVSMLNAETLNLLNEVFQAVRYSEAPFGGVQMIFFGDFLQLPPVQGGFAFESGAWADAAPKVFHMTTVYRQEDAAFLDILHRARFGQMDDAAVAALSQTQLNGSAVNLFALNAPADRYNMNQLQRLKGKMHSFPAFDDGLPALLKNCITPASLWVKEGARVMLTINLNVGLGLVNGSMGTVIQIKDGTVKVQFDNGMVMELGRETVCKVTQGKKVLATRIQYPLRLAWAISIHKCVGLNTLIETENGLQRIGKTENIKMIATPDGPKECSGTVFNPEMSGLRITTEKGYTIEITDDHGMNVEGTRVAGKDIKVGDKLTLVCGSCIPESDRQHLPQVPRCDVRCKEYKVPEFVNEDFAEFLGLLVADGTLYKMGFRMAKRHQDVSERFRELCSKLFGYEPITFHKLGAYHVEVNSSCLSSWLKLIGGVEPNKKAIPNCILESSVSLQRKFLRGLFEDGSVNVRGDSFSHIEWSTKSEQMSSDVQVMLLRSGIVSSRAFYKNCWRVNIYGKDAARFRDTIGFISSFKHDRLATAGNHHKKRGVVTTKHLHLRVKSIEKIVMESACVEVFDGHRFIQNGFDGFNSQGMTLDHVRVDMDGIFEYGQAYVALSRAKRIEGLEVRNLIKSGVKAHPAAVEFYRGIEE